MVRWQILDINVKKTKEILIDFRKNKTEVPPIIIEGEVVERVKVYKYLGIEIDNQLKIALLAKSNYNQLQQRLFFFTVILQICPP